jgi:acyl-coenzyme A thioesterase PaaI-like protein
VIEWRDPLAIGNVTFATPYEGPPGCVHGGVIAATFDQVLNAANLVRGLAGPTRQLDLTYRRPTPLGQALRFEGWQERVEGREIHTRGRLLVGDQITVEARGVFVKLSPERVMRLLG